MPRSVSHTTLATIAVRRLGPHQEHHFKRRDEWLKIYLRSRSHR